ncbi:MAG: C10 family peptidase [Bacteroidales bacterium]|nr:C10 family peptidase [Bacteroidales bacterium]
MKKLNFFILLTIITSFIISSCSDETVYTNNTHELFIPKLESNVTVQMAEDVAYTFMNKESNLKSAKSVKLCKEFQIPFSERKLFLVQFVEGGYVLMSDNTKGIPVLAFSEGGNFNFEQLEQLPEGPRQWLLESILINFELENNPELRELNNIDEMWKAYLPKDKSTANMGEDDCFEVYLGEAVRTKGPFLTTRWDQRSPYNMNNDDCPDGSKEPAGCVTIALAQIMNYWEYPENLVNWDILINNYPSYDTSSATALEVGILVDNIFDNVIWMHDCESSTATDLQAKNALCNIYNYSPAITNKTYNRLELEQDLDKWRPVYLSGCNEYTMNHCHAWVCDGIQRRGPKYRVTCYYNGETMISEEIRTEITYFHMNYGWDDSSNAWYSANNIANPSSRSDRNYQYYKKMITNIHP